MIKVCGLWAFVAASQEEGGIRNLGLEKPESILETRSEGLLRARRIGNLWENLSPRNGRDALLMIPKQYPCLNKT